MFRTFQGFLSLSTVKPGEGTLRVCPLIKLSTAYFIMRPLLDDLIDSKYVDRSMYRRILKFYILLSRRDLENA